MSRDWKSQLREAAGSIAELKALGYSAPFAFLDAEGEAALEARYQVKVPRYYLGLIDKNDPADPIARMALPRIEELTENSQDKRDPIGDVAKQAAPRLTHRYNDRALLHVTNLCQMYCRFCFRKNLMNEREPELYAGDFDPAFAYLKAHPEIEELILSGGDPWLLGDEKIAALMARIRAELPGLKRLRFHTRMPVTLPARVTPELIAALGSGGPQIFIVTHFNHPRELSAEADVALARLRSAGFVLLNQGVLLRGVNDSAEVLRELYRGLGNRGVLPYYLHQCDQAAGTNHFRVGIPEGRKIWRELRGTLPGYLLPEYVLEIPGGGGKVPLGESAVRESGAGNYRILGRQGEEVLYREASAFVREDGFEAEVVR